MSDVIKFDPDEFVWENKYRPKNIEDVALPAKLKTYFKETLAAGELQNFIFYSEGGGTGKTTSALALAHGIGCSRPFFINGSLDNGIGDIRTDVIEYTSSASLIDSGHKVVIVDEADGLSDKAMLALKGVIEKVSKRARFIFTTNDVDVIPSHIISRCPVVSFEFNDKEQMEVMTQGFKRVTEILQNEGVEYEMQALAQIIKVIMPDTRKLMSELQRLYTIYKKIDMSVVEKVSVVDIDAFGKLIKSKDYGGLKAFIMEHHKKMKKTFFSKMFDLIEPMLEEQSSPMLVKILGENQKHFNKTPDLYIFWLNIVVEILIECTFKE